MLDSAGGGDSDHNNSSSSGPSYIVQEPKPNHEQPLKKEGSYELGGFVDEELDSPLLLSLNELPPSSSEEEGDDGEYPGGPVYNVKNSTTYQKLLRRLQKAATNLRFARKWLVKIVMAQTLGNLIRALPVFILEKYYIMLIIFFQGIFLICGYYGIKTMRPYLMLVYSIGGFIVTVMDILTATTYAPRDTTLPPKEAVPVFTLYLMLLFVLCVLNIFGACFLGLRMCVSVTLLKNPQDQSLVLLAASWIGSFDSGEDEDKNKGKKVKRRIIYVNSANTQQTMEFCSNEVKTSRYNVLTFVPKLLYMQFSRLANLYTLMVVFLCMFSFSPVGPTSSLTPLLVVLGVSGGKEFVEDVRRHKQDAMINGRPSLVLCSTTHAFLPKCWKDVRVGDIVMVRKDEQIPADLLLLSSSRADGRCYLETANLDGETNLKVRVQLPQFAKLQSAHELTTLMDSQVSLECEAPNNNIYTFEGVLTMKADPITTISRSPSLTPANRSPIDTPVNRTPAATPPTQSPATSTPSSPKVAPRRLTQGSRQSSTSSNLSSTNLRSNLKRSLSLHRSPTSEPTQSLAVTGDMLLQRGTTLRNTEFVYGLPVYTGPDTKVEQNGLVAPLKRSSMERSVNTKLLVLFLLQTIICIVCSIGHNAWHLGGNTRHPWYLDEPQVEFIYISYLILYNTMIPLSMYVSMEMVRVTNANSLGNDAAIPQSVARTTNIIEELGQVRYLFADKTGTLTRNQMIVRQLSISGQCHILGPSSSSSSTSQKLLTHTTTDDVHAVGTLLVMAVCNTVQVEEKNQEGEQSKDKEHTDEHKNNDNDNDNDVVKKILRIQSRRRSTRTSSSSTGCHTTRT